MIAGKPFLILKTIYWLMATIKDVGERALIKNLLNIIRSAPGLGPGDDAAVFTTGKGDQLACTDMLTFDRHFPKGMTYEQFGWSAAAVNFSDLAAMGAKPTGILSALALPEDLDESAVYDIMSGIDQCAEFCDTFIIGGDTKPGPGAVAVTALGSMNGLKPLRQNGARPGDIVAVTGELGKAAAGFYAIENDIENEDLIFSLMVPTPRVEEGRILAKSGAVSSCIDLSDGLAVAAKRICEASHVGMDIEEEFIPVGEGVEDICERLNVPLRDLTIYWGGDYELMFTFNKDKIQKLYDMELEFSIIGMVNNSDGAYIVKEGEREALKDGKY